jgi:hypothetical protein
MHTELSPLNVNHKDVKYYEVYNTCSSFLYSYIPVPAAVVLAGRRVIAHARRADQYGHTAHCAHDMSRINIMRAIAVNAPTHHYLFCFMGTTTTTVSLLQLQLRLRLSSSAGSGWPHRDATVEHEVFALEQPSVRKIL